ncbi:hypothetical protein LIER_19577 [Lithospermum erythrorhizon]|uniref:Uncharacterized protein n=1 Tax=Lithospermum erythrorhizon TaxID=34254 RepID=A0AAV3QJ54_LITER
MSTGLTYRCVTSGGKRDTGAVTLEPNQQLLQWPVQDTDLSATCHVFTFNGLHQDIVVFDQYQVGRCGATRLCDWVLFDSNIGYYIGNHFQIAYTWIHN